MASGYPGDAVRQINRLFLDGTAAGLTDGQLIERFTTRRAGAAETAFEALVNRHGPMVLRVVKGVLRDPHDVEDAFQATFLVLVKKAHAIGERDLLAPWLYGVAHRVALKARAVAAKRNKREGGVIDDPPAELAEGPWLDLRPILHEELNRLPDKYKKPVILCHLQGLTHAEAAQELAWPVGTVSVRLARAKNLLKDRLTRRGLTATATLWAAGLTAETASAAALPQALIQSTTRLALQAITGKLVIAGGVSVGAITLSKRTLTMMLMSRLKWLIVPLALTFGAAGGMVLNQQIMLRSADLKAKPELAVAEATKPAEARTTRTPRPPAPTPGRSPFGPDDRAPAPSNQPPAGFAAEGEEKPLKVGPPLVVRNGQVVLDPPPGYFDLPATHKNDGTDPPIIKPGQILLVEALEALPGRPITGERVVRPDGTISLGFYGDLRVAGLNRLQIKLKLIEHLRQYIQDEALGLVTMDSTDRFEAVPPLQSNRIVVDESPNYFPVRQENGGRPTLRGEGFYNNLIKSNRIEMLEGKIIRATKELKDLRELVRRDKTADPKIPINENADDHQQEAESLKKADTEVRLIVIESQLYKALKELDELKGDGDPSPADPASSTKSTEANPAEKPPG